jgi:adenylate cyclase
MGSVVSIAVIWVRSLGRLQELELLAYDYCLGLHRTDASPDERIVAIKIAESDIRKQGHWPMTDAEVATLLNSVAGYKPSVIGLDMYRDIPVPPGKEMLLETFRTHKNIISVRKIGDDLSSGVPGPYAVTSPEAVGFNDLITDPDGIIRRGLLFLDDGKNVYSSFSLLLAAHYLKGRGILPEPGKENPEHLKLGKVTFAPLAVDHGGYADIDTRGYQFLLDFRRHAFNSVSIEDLKARKGAPGAFAGKVVIIGATAESLKDLFHTPLSKTLASQEFTYGMELHAMMASQLIRFALGESKPTDYPRKACAWGWITFWGLIGGLLALMTRPMWRFFLFFLLALAFILFVPYFALGLGWWIPLVPPLLTCFISAGFAMSYISYVEKTERRVLMQLFAKHVSHDVATAIWKDREKFMRHGRPHPQKLIATVLFTDLKDFTTISEKLEPQVLMGWLNEYMDAMASVIIKHAGTINKYIGDSIMAIFGVPLPRESEPEIALDATNAVMCALEMGSQMERLNADWEKRMLPTASMRTGIFTGPLVAGCLGSSERMEYTVIGDTVNIASRLEGFGKGEGSAASRDRPWRILIGEATRVYLGHGFETVSVGTVSLKGKEEKIGVHLVTGRAQ